MPVSAPRRFRLRLERTVELHRRVLRDVLAAADAPVGRQHDLAAILMHNRHRPPLKVSRRFDERRTCQCLPVQSPPPAIRTRSRLSRPAPTAALAGRDETARPKLPFAAGVIDRLVGQRNVKRKRLARWIDHARQVANREGLGQRRPRAAGVFGKLGGDRPGLLGRAAQQMRFAFEAPPFDQQLLVTGEVTQHLPRRDLFAQFDAKLFDFEVGRRIGPQRIRVRFQRRANDPLLVFLARRRDGSGRAHHRDFRHEFPWRCLRLARRRFRVPPARTAWRRASFPAAAVEIPAPGRAIAGPPTIWPAERAAPAADD